MPYLFRIYAVLLHLQHCVFDPVDFEALCQDVRRIGVGVDDDFHLIRVDLRSPCQFVHVFPKHLHNLFSAAYLEVWRVSPVVFAIDTEDGGAVNIATADKAIVCIVSGLGELRRGIAANLVSMYAVREFSDCTLLPTTTTMTYLARTWLLEAPLSRRDKRDVCKMRGRNVVQRVMQGCGKVDRFRCGFWKRRMLDGRSRAGRRRVYVGVEGCVNTRLALCQVTKP